MSITVVIIGGTIDSYYNPVSSTAEPLLESCIPSYLKSLNMDRDISYIPVCMKDSRDVSGEDLEAIYAAINSSSNEKFIVTHGTFAMEHTAKFLLEKLKGSQKKVILVGSVIPLTGFCPSDAGFNLGFAIAALDYIEKGVYVGMNGTIFLADNVSKLPSEGKFVSLTTK